MDKEALRERVWDRLEESGEARFPFPLHGRIPNFAGAEEAAERLGETDVWRDAAVVKANPDAPQLPVRRAALREGKTVYVAVPRLREEKCFLRLAPDEVEDVDHATTIGGSAEVGESVAPEAVEPVDLVVAGSVAVDERGGRVGKGEGYSDLEFAVLAEFGLVGEPTTVATTVHELQVVESEVPLASHDVPLDLVVTPDRAVRTDTPHERPDGVEWSALPPPRLEAIPVLAALRERGR